MVLSIAMSTFSTENSFMVEEASERHFKFRETYPLSLTEKSDHGLLVQRSVNNLSDVRVVIRPIVDR